MKPPSQLSSLAALCLCLVACPEQKDTTGSTAPSAAAASAATSAAAPSAPEPSASSSATAEEIDEESKKAVLKAAADYFGLLYSGRHDAARDKTISFEQMQAITTAYPTRAAWDKEVDDFYKEHDWTKEGELTLQGTQIVETAIVRRGAGAPKLKQDLYKAWVQPNLEKDGKPFLIPTLAAGGAYQHPGYFIKTPSGWMHSPVQ